MKTKKKMANNLENFEQDYKTIMEGVPATLTVLPQWTKPGDAFAKFTLYQEYTPVKTSCGTTLLCKF